MNDTQLSTTDRLKSAVMRSASRVSALFRLVYWVGVMLTFLMMFSYAGTPPEAINLPFLPEAVRESGAILVLSYSHMLLLIVLGLDVSGWLKLIPKRRHARAEVQHVGTQVQTAGYLHTLIGFGAALFALQPDDLQVMAVLMPIGSALGTSILGWFVGGEIVGRTMQDDQEEAQDKLRDLVDGLDRFIGDASTKHQVYLDTMTKVVSLQKQAAQQQEEALKIAKETKTVVAEQFKGIQRAARRLKVGVTTLTETVDATLGSDAWRDDMQALAAATSAARSHVEKSATQAKELEEHLRESAQAAKTSRVSLEGFAADVPTAHTNYAALVQTAHQAAESITQVLEAILERFALEAVELQDASTTLQPLRTTLKEIDGLMNELVQSVEDVRVVVADVGTSGERTVEAIRETGHTARRLTTAVRQSRDIIEDMYREVYHDGHERP